ncbi:MAG: putative lipid II flippase FtsW [Candidatus Yanofskybacteria bacterium CG10_big_fil_rev_8_21_14_0_10_37_15]|uniref:Probable peptidoglycan glycosyltransferase FtsW n=1 Tax=Candidatus Yanofskybacteria bacterium CG10_big_fil_rev_8_21_14_0_10_37_15 TaxID=1975097 RepID=A0A2H0R5R1_9BACT|nr:MAG: putative lipid II flippase FtsW [Candidatus Yanofskybacteria bacterium CG10_big_fil_rev_8_21_14_0_10_37_15]
MAKKLFILILIMVVFGLAILSSAGLPESQDKFGSSYYFVKHQFLYGVIPGLFGLILFSWFDYKFWKKVSLPLLFGSLFLMVLVFVPNIGHGLKGATRWLNLGPFTIQPAEILKLCLIIYLAAWFSNRGDRKKNWSYGAAPFFIIMAFIILLLYLQPDIGTLIVVLMIGGGIYFLSGRSWKEIISVGIIAAILLSVFAISSSYRWDRIRAFMNPEEDPRGISYQINQSLIAIGSGGLFGVGFQNSSQKQGFLPEVLNDSVFAIIAEELGYIGSVAVIIMFVLLSFLITQIAKSAPDKFAALFVMGMNVWVISQAFVNVAAISGLVPLTGIPLPFISYGGTAIAVLLSGLGIVLNVAKKV